jgi:toxin ParE1/3/4
MSYVLHISSRAEADIAAAYDWYQARRAGLGTEFVATVEAVIMRVQDSPQLFRIRWGRHRLAMMPRFPYAIYFIWSETTSFVSIRRVLHLAKNFRGQL